MAAGTLLTLLDDIATLLDDVAVLTKVAAKQTGAVLGDDLALNAQQVAGVRADRELPVVWAVARGSLRNKLILVPAALAVSAALPWLIVPLLMIGGIYLCYEGMEKLAHRFLHPATEQSGQQAARLDALMHQEVDLVAFEREKIRGAIRTDFVLSAEIVVITLGAVAEADFGTRVLVLSGIAVLMTIGVYGVVAAIVKLDDAGLYLSRRGGALTRWAGRGLLWLAPNLMKLLAVAGTLAMFLVGGGILVHGVGPLHHAVEHLVLAGSGVGGAGAALAVLTPLVANAVIGMAAGAVVLSAVFGWEKLRSRREESGAVA